MAKNARKKGMEQHPNPIKKPVSNKQPSLIHSEKQKGRYTHNYAVRAYFLSVTPRLACIASFSVGLGSKERPRKGTGMVFCPREIGARANSPEPHENACYAGYAKVAA